MHNDKFHFTYYVLASFTYTKTNGNWWFTVLLLASNSKAERETKRKKLGQIKKKEKQVNEEIVDVLFKLGRSKFLFRSSVILF